jgi:hypothetical protein
MIYLHKEWGIRTTITMIVMTCNVMTYSVIRV